ncbi:hypothetical protein HMPREF1503_1997 [Olsenella uli MSTE5]|nr:hypothetical protein HMPREF1503_1997 [Olsenella uli MSTE5]
MMGCALPTWDGAHEHKEEAPGQTGSLFTSRRYGARDSRSTDRLRIAPPPVHGRACVGCDDAVHLWRSSRMICRVTVYTCVVEDYTSAAALAARLVV